MHDLLVNDDAKGLKRSTGFLKSSVDTLDANLCGCMLKYSMAVGLEHHLQHYTSGCLKFCGAESFLCYLFCLRYFSSLVFRVRFLQRQKLAHEPLLE